MYKRIKLVAAVSVAASLLVPAAGAGASTLGKPRPSTGRFAGVSNVRDLNVTCAPGADFGPASLRPKIKMTRRTTGYNPADLGDTKRRSTRIVATYPGGSQSLGRFENFYSLPRNFNFPCPPSSSQVTGFDILLQPYRGRVPVGTPAAAHINLHRVGSAS